MGKIISLVQLKGGVGRSTIATNLAGTLAEHSRVVLVDCDAPQYTSSHWFKQRKELYDIEEVIDLVQPASYRGLATSLVKLKKSFDFVVIDGPPRLDPYSRLAMVSSDFCLFPLGPSAAEIWSVEEMLKTVNEVKQYNPGFDGRVLWNRFRSYTKTAQVHAKEAKKSLKLPEMRQKLSLRVAYAEAMSEGLTVHEMDDKVARLEMWSLSSTIQRMLNNQKHPNKLSKEAWLDFAKG
jgi:chromosome partitioning protein